MDDYVFFAVLPFPQKILHLPHTIYIMNRDEPPDAVSEVFLLAKSPPFRAHLSIHNITPDIISSTPCGQTIHGSLFSAHGAQWRPCIKLGGSSRIDEGVEGRIAAYIKLVTPNFEKKLSFELSIGDKMYKAERLFSTISASTIHGTSAGWGTNNLVRHAEIAATPAKFITDGVMTMVVTLKDISPPCTTLPADIFAARIEKVSVPSPSMTSDMLELLHTARNADVTLVCGGENFRVHSGIISQRSPTFAAQLAHSADLSAVHVDSSITPVTLRRLLEFIYTDTITPMPTSSEEVRCPESVMRAHT